MKIPRFLFILCLLLIRSITSAIDSPKSKGASIDFNSQIRPILTENCFKCHGPDDAARKAKLRFDIRDEALKPAKDGKTAIVPGSAEKSELIARVTTKDDDDRMPPIKSGKHLTQTQIDLLRRWILQGAPYATHWAYVKPVRAPLPEVKNKRWVRNAIDRFILARLEREGLKPSPEADRYTLIRRVSLDLTGLPPTLEEVDGFVKDRNPNAYEHLVDRLLAKDAFGEHWARMWLDLARYADSAGYADDPPRTIWKYRDYVIKSFNCNKPFDRFTLEQIAGDLLDDSDEETLVGTAFHRNTMTNNEGGTNDEEFRNAAVVDRVNTTMAVWMATSMACAQCHNHKYDPISQQEYFRFFAFFNNTADADLNDESPLLKIFSPEQKSQRTKWQSEITEIEKKFKSSTPDTAVGEREWEEHFPRERQWSVLEPTDVKAKSGGAIAKVADKVVKFAPQLKAETYNLDFSVAATNISGLRLEILPPTEKPTAEETIHAGFSISHVSAVISAPATNHISARYLRLELPGKERILSLAEVQVFSGETNIALRGEAKQSTTAFEGAASRAIDGNTDGTYDKASTTHTENSKNPWWEIDLKTIQPVDRITIWNRTDNGLQSRMKGLRMQLLDENRNPLWQRTVKEAPDPKSTFTLHGPEPIEFVAAFADGSQSSSELKSLIEEPAREKKGWVMSADDNKTHHLTLLLAKPLVISPNSTLQLTVKQTAQHDHCPPALLRISASDDAQLSQYAAVPDSVFGLLTRSPSERTSEQQAAIWEYYRANIAPELKPERDRIAKLQKQIADQTPTTVPVMRELTGAKRRTTHIQFRGNYLALGDEVTEAVPAAFNPLQKIAKPNRLTLAKWLVDTNNPLSSRVMANRFWEQIFGIGIVRTSEDFGSQGDRPTNPELLDWLASQFRDGDSTTAPWDVKAFLKLLVTSATYRQSSRVTPELQERDPDNLLLARGPRFRMSAEIVRDQALAISGLLSHKMYGPSVRPPRPSLGLSAAFGGSLDWKTSDGEDRYRRALYVEWRRTSPYPSMATFDAPNREVCTIRRPRSNTPLQALVTLNDPVYVEAAQALARRMSQSPGATTDKLRYGFRLCAARPPQEEELNKLVKFYESAKADYSNKPNEAKKLAGADSSKSAQPSEITELAAWTAVGNVLLNLDETLMRP